MPCLVFMCALIRVTPPCLLDARCKKVSARAEKLERISNKTEGGGNKVEGEERKGRPYQGVVRGAKETKAGAEETEEGGSHIGVKHVIRCRARHVTRSIKANQGIQRRIR
jgi:hypothetical protein